MRGWQWIAVFVGGLGLSGCGASDSSPTVGLSDPYGGQTGSLTPCGVARSFERGQPIPSGDSVLVIHTENCRGEAPAVTVLSPDGMPINIELEELDDGTFLARTDTVLEPGTYTIIQTSADGESESSSDLVVEEAAPLPVTLGTLEQTNAVCTGMSFDLILSPEALPYAPLLSLSISIDGAGERLWVDYGELELDGDRALLFLDRCDQDGCLSSGAHEFRVRAKIAGDMAEPDVVEGELQARCSSLGTDEGCSLSKAPSSRLPLLILFLLPLIRVRRWFRLRPPC